MPNTPQYFTIVEEHQNADLSIKSRDEASKTD